MNVAKRDVKELSGFKKSAPKLQLVTQDFKVQPREAARTEPRDGVNSEETNPRLCLIMARRLIEMALRCDSNEYSAQDLEPYRREVTEAAMRLAAA
jgi:hypothetical protein